MAVPGGERMMYLKITGKNETLEELNKAKKMIEEASKILHHLQFAIGVELVDDTEQETKADPDNQ